MKKSMIILLFLTTFFVFSFQLESHASQWIKVLGGSAHDQGVLIEETNDKGYILTGLTSSFGAGIFDVWVIKLNQEGEVIWQKLYNGSEYESGLVTQTLDGGYILLGNIYGTDGGDLLLVKLNSSGEIVWQKKYKGSGKDTLTGFFPTSDGGYVIVGDTTSFGAGGSDIFIIKVDSMGNISWQKTYGGSKDEVNLHSLSTSDGGYILTGYTTSYGMGGRDIFVIKINSNGNIVWQKTYGGSGDDDFTSIKETSDGGYIIAANTTSFGAGGRDLWLIKINSTGGIVWQKTYGGSGEESGGIIKETSDGGYIIAANTTSFGAGGRDLWLMKINSTGGIVWQKTYGGSGDDYAWIIKESPDGGYILGGGTTSFGAGGRDLWLMKINSTGGIVWQKTYGGSGDDTIGLHSNVSDNNFIGVGLTDSTGAGSNDLIAVKIDENGNIPNCNFQHSSSAIIKNTSVIANTTNVSANNISMTIKTPNFIIQNSSLTTKEPAYTSSDVCFYSPKVVVKFLKPNGGEKWKAGLKYVIKWEAPLDSYKFNLRYSTDNKTTWTNIATVLASNRCKSDGTKYTCTYGWTIPAQDGRKPQSFVRVRAFNGSNQTIGTDDSDKAFAIEVLRVTSPNGGETLKVGSTHTITWETYALTKTVARVQLQYSTNNGQSWTNIKTLTGNPVQYSWTVPNTPSTNCKVRVILKDSTGAEIARDVSDRVFTISQ